MKFKPLTTNSLSSSISKAKEISSSLAENAGQSYAKSREFLTSENNRKKVLAAAGIVSIGTIIGAFTILTSKNKN